MPVDARKLVACTRLVRSCTTVASLRGRLLCTAQRHDAKHLFSDRDTETGNVPAFALAFQISPCSLFPGLISFAFFNF